MPISKEVSVAIIRLNASMIAIDGKINDEEIEQSSYFLNTRFHLNTTFEQIKKLTDTNIDIDQELEIILKAELGHRDIFAIVNSLVMIAVSDSEYHQKETELVFKIAEAFGVIINDEEVERLTILQNDLSKLRIKTQASEKKVNDAIQSFNEYVSEIKDPDQKKGLNELKNKFNNFIDNETSNASKAGKAISEAIKYGEITTDEYLNYVNFINTQPVQFKILDNSLAANSPEKYIENIKKFSQKDKTMSKDSKNKILLYLFFPILLLLFIIYINFTS